MCESPHVHYYVFGHSFEVRNTSNPTGTIRMKYSHSRDLKYLLFARYHTCLTAKTHRVKTSSYDAKFQDKPSTLQLRDLTLRTSIPFLWHRFPSQISSYTSLQVCTLCPISGHPTLCHHSSLRMNTRIKMYTI